MQLHSNVQRNLVRLAGIAALLGTATAQTGGAAALKLKRNDQILGNGRIVQFEHLAVTDSGLFYTDVRSDDSQNDRVTLLNGFMVMVTRTNVAEPPGALFDLSNDLSVNKFGFIGWPVKLRATIGGNADDTGVYWNTLLLTQEGADVVNPFIDGIALGVDTVYSGFDYVFLNDKNHLLVAGDVQDPTFKGKESSLALLKTDGQGNLTEEIWLGIQDYPFQGGPNLDGIGGQKDSFGFNNNDDWMAQVKIDDSNTSDTGIVYNGVFVAREGDAHPTIAGRAYADFGTSRLGMNDMGDYVFTATLDGANEDNLVLMRNQEVFAREGSSVSGFAPDTIIRFDSAPQKIANSGDVYWYASISGSSNQSRVYMRNKRVIVQEAVSVIGPGTLNGLRTTAYAFTVSPNGRFWLAEVVLANGNEAVILADFGSIVPIPGCGSNPVTLQKAATSGDARIGETVVFEMDGAVPTGATPFLIWSTQALATGLECGRMFPFGELFISPAAANVVSRSVGAPYTGTAATFTYPIPQDPSLANMESFAQGFFRENDGTLHLSNGMHMVLGS